MITKDDIEKFISTDMPSLKAQEIMKQLTECAKDNVETKKILEAIKEKLEKIIENGVENLEKFVDEEDTKVTNHPKRYLGKSGIEAIDIIEYTVSSLPGDLAFNVGTAVKYLSRLGKKKTTDENEDWKKTLWYINRALFILNSK